MVCKIPECQPLDIDHESYARWDDNQLAQEASGMLKVEYRQGPRDIQLKEGGPLPVDSRRQQITHLALGCLALLAVCAGSAIAFHALVIPSLVASVGLIATVVMALKIWRQPISSFDHLKVIAHQINAGHYRGLRNKIKPLLNEQFSTPGNALYLNRNAVKFHNWVEARVDRSHHNGGIHFDANVGMAMLIDAFDSLQHIKNEKQFAVLRQDVIIGLRLASGRRIDLNFSCEKAFGYIVLHRPLAEAKAILEKAIMEKAR